MWEYIRKFALIAALGMAPGFGSALAQTTEKIDVPADFSPKTINLVVPWGTGGGSDQMARAMARAIERISSISVIVLNKPGGNGTVGLTYALSQPSDGHTMALITNDFLLNHAAGAATIEPDDFDYVARIVADLEMLFARADDERFQSFKDYIEAAETNSGALTIATAGQNGIEQLAMSLVNKALGIEVRWLPFDQPGERVAAFLGGHVDLMVEEPSDMKQYIDDGMIRPLVQLTEQRTTAFPDTPTASEFGADVSLGLWRGLAVRSGTDPDMLAFLEELVAAAAHDPAFISNYLQERNLDIRPGYLDAREFEKAVQSEYESISGVILP